MIQADQIPALLAQQIGCFPSVEKVILFGSRARGDFDKTSDIDLAVACPGADFEEWSRIEAMEQSPITIMPINIRRYENLKGMIRALVDKEGKVLYERSQIED